VTLRDVANRAGTSVAAVSAVLGRGRHQSIRVGEATRQRILAVAEELGYVPNLLARSLVTRKTGVLGFLTPYRDAFIAHEPFATQLFSGVLEECMRREYGIMLLTTAGDDWTALDPRRLLDPRLDGLLVSIPPPGSPLVDRCREVGFPCVAVVYEPDGPGVCVVNADDFHGGELATEHLIRLGHRRIAHLLGTPGIASTEPRRRGYLAALAAAGIAAEPALQLAAGYGWRDGYRTAGGLLDLPAERRPTAVFAANDLCAEGVLRALGERGLRAPDDLAVVGFDDTWHAAYIQPPLTSVHMPIYSMGARAVQMLAALAEGAEVGERQPTLPVTLTIRESCGAGGAEPPP
jgi:LacI family transcriptional regulator